ncbi:iron-sulfur cluster assembly scaffold protein [Mycoplasma iguanae]|uniref:Iron-sulfur cluster assembly scaffold protein n=1 Tax=Mycoplasma iguanae TaxID=292461 RepID=A0ABY5R934_9MOLU|nr:iron-sulfur cluster assembly scaffold protein [Mycoplasma iguanae]UVD81943.1 iron-sulfur cluster assembly scaffold protein [Mycoplasma iguanae]
MPSYSDEKTKRELIMSHYSNPIYKKEELPTWENIKIHSDYCVDNMEIAFHISNQKFTEVFFKGEGCAVFLAAVDLFIDEITGKNIEEAKTIAHDYEKVLKQEMSQSAKINQLNIFQNVKTHLNRLECALLVKKAFDKLEI